MRTPLLLIALVLGVAPATSAADPADRFPGLNLVPWPQDLRLDMGRLCLTATSRVVARQKELAPLAEILAGEIATLTGLRLKTAAGADRPNDIVLTLDRDVKAGTPILAVRNRELVRTRDGAHRVTVSDRAIIAGFDVRAVAEGSATLLQALGQEGGAVSLPKLAIHDWPHADYCAMMVDVGRQDHPVVWLRKMIDVCRFYKVRYLQLHLTDDQGWTFPSTKYPRLGSKNYGAHGGKAPKVYTLAELRGLVAYADARGVTLVPEIEMPGHSGAALRSVPEIFDAINPRTGQPVGLGCMNMASEALYPALDTIVGEVCDVFRSSPYFHMGGDEVSMGRVSLHPGYKAYMAKHGLKDDAELGAHFVRRVNDIVKKHGKKTLKWEGLANEASKDVIVVAWDNNNATAGRLIAKGFTTITCPWNLGVPWDQWSMYVCNGSRLKQGDAVLGATLVAWEQPPQTHLAGVRNVAARQERTWNPDHAVTEAGFAARFRPLDAAVSRLLGTPITPRLPATFDAPAGTRDLLEPAFAFDGDEATFHQSARPLTENTPFTIALAEPRTVEAVEVLTGINGRGRLEGGAVQVSADGKSFRDVATLKDGVARARLDGATIRALRLRTRAGATEPLVVREIALRLRVGLAGAVKNPVAAVGAGNVAALTADATFTLPGGDCEMPVRAGGFTLTLDAGGGARGFAGAIDGQGAVTIRAAAPGGAVILKGKAPNTLRGAWAVESGRLVLAKPAGVTALGGAVTVTGRLVWAGDDQIDDAAHVQMRRGAALELAGHRETIDRLTLDSGALVQTGGGVLTVREATVDGQRLARGVYTAAWVRGGGYVAVGGARAVALAGDVGAPDRTVGAGNIAILKGAATFRLPAGESTVPCDTKTFPLTLATNGTAAHCTGFITGSGPLRIDAAGPGARQPLVIAGAAPNAYRGPTVLARGVLRLAKTGGALAIPGDLSLGGSTPENDGDGIVWGADGQVPSSANVTLAGERPSFLDLDGHRAVVAKLVLSRAAILRTGAGGSLRARQLHVAGKRLPDGTYRAPQPWLRGTGTVTVDARVNVRGSVGDWATRIGAGNVANLTADASICYPASDCDCDVLTNGHTLTLDSGNGNPFILRGAIHGTGNVVLLMGPSHTDYRDAPLRLAGARPNTTTGRYFVRKGRVQLEKPAGVDAISGDVTVGGQGFNDCLFWLHNDQIKDDARITLIGAGNSGAAYLHLNGCRETVAALTLGVGNRVKTDSPAGARGTLTVRALTVEGKRLPAGTYTAANAKWIEGKGQVVVRAAAPPAPIQHRVLVQGNGKLAIVGADGAIEWQMPWGAIHDLHVLNDGHILTQQGAARVVEIDPKTKKVVWSYDSAVQNGNKGRRVEVHSFQPLGDGQVLIAESGAGRLIEVDRAGKLLRTIKLTIRRPNPHHDTRLVRKLDSGHYLVCHEGDGAVREYDARGAVVWEYDVPLFGQKPRGGHGAGAWGNQTFAALRLANGNTLITTGNGHSVLEVTPQKKIAWQLRQKDLPKVVLAWVTTIEVLPNGHYVLGNCHAGPGQPLLVEIDPATRRVVWTFDQYERWGNSVSNTKLLGRAPAVP